MANKKTTKKEYFGMLLNIEGVTTNQALVDFINHEIELLDKKTTSRKQTATQVENEGIKDTILQVLATSDKPMTISDIQAENDSLAQYKNQKISALLQQLIATNKVVRTEIKKKAYFTLTDTVEND